MSFWVEPGREILKLLKLVDEAELTTEVSIELTLDSYGEAGAYFSCVQPP